MFQGKIAGLYTVLIVSSVLVASGCGGGNGLKVVPVKGTVTIADGQPFAKGTLHFRPSGVGKRVGGTATTNDEGRYELKHQSQAKGIEAGDYYVSFSLWQLPDGSPLPDQQGESEPKSAEELGAVQRVPREYSWFESTKVQVTVPANGGTLDLKIPELKLEPKNAK